MRKAGGQEGEQSDSVIGARANHPAPASRTTGRSTGSGCRAGYPAKGTSSLLTVRSSPRPQAGPERFDAGFAALSSLEKASKLGNSTLGGAGASGPAIDDCLYPPGRAFEGAMAVSRFAGSIRVAPPTGPKGNALGADRKPPEQATAPQPAGPDGP